MSGITKKTKKFKKINKKSLGRMVDFNALTWYTNKANEIEYTTKDRRTMIDESILKKDELAVFALRKLYSTHGYKKYKMRKFEEYDFYSENKDFLASEGIITFTDADGRLLALKPDVTL